MIRVLVADDEPMVRTGVRAILSTAPDIDVVAEAARCDEAVRQARTHLPHVAVLDIRMPGGDGIEAAAEIRRTVPGTAVVMLTTFGQDDYILRALGDGGATGFLIKSGEPEELIAGVRAVAGGAAYLSPKVAARVVAHLASGAGAAASRRAAARGRLDTLTTREREVLIHLAAGLSNRQIGRRLDLAEGTVKAHVSSILTRLGVGNRAAAAVTAHEAGLGQP
ncbi:DNA-binding response regulator, NarL/FixJ family, contains REC and HTH domains [Nonomuraea solani]|uniref:DNA-binding response regulator, NarL/FixJ family, contains REC and HTH domains n=1 Tax=Nonomuraea solani TaxID=1144553 RepID=A0A1H6BJM8_9ACTN|nr:response regulator transcription factor [Nonomuraea solani]SEG60396.1 DNA-binding response regulator, NarL/FixJ family, contains REC and HTH domains [Nonomuraea solani]